VSELLDRLLGVPRRVAVELEWDIHEDDDGETTWVLALHAIVEAPGPDHSEYSTVRLAAFPAESLDDRREAHRVTAGVAARAGIPWHAPPLDEQGGRGGSAWIRARPPGAPVPYPFAWSARWWSDDGREHATQGTESVSARSGRDAQIELQRQLEVRFPERPLEMLLEGQRIRILATTSIDVDAVRATALVEGSRPSRIARSLAGASGRSLMIAFEHAFGLRFESLGALARWRAGELDDTALDAALAAAVSGNRATWDRPRRLRELRARGESVAAAIRADRQAGMIVLIVAAREAFGLSLAQAKELVDRACADASSDAELDGSLGA
jgi:hypothetical protein